MPDLTSNQNFLSSQVKSKSPTRLLVILFISFLAIGVGVGYVINSVVDRTPIDTTPTNTVVEPDFYEGTITYIEPFLHPEDEISYILVDKNDEDIILLKAKDQKLEVAEGHYAVVYGQKRKTVMKEDYLLVDKIVIKNATD